MKIRTRVWAAALILVAAVAVVVWYASRREDKQEKTTVTEPQAAGAPKPAQDNGATRIHAHNLLLRKGPDFRIYVRWLDGRLERTRRNVDPSFDRPDSFVLGVESGVIRVNIGDIAHYLNSVLTDAPLQNIALVADGANLKLTGTLHKVVPLPVEVSASVAADPGDRVRVHIQKITVLKVPVKGLMKVLHISPADLVKSKIAGLEVQGNDIVLNTTELLPPPHIRGELTKVRVDSPDVEAVFGDAAQDLERVEMWRNFFSLKGVRIDFGSLTMHPVNIMMIDISANPWFDLDLVNYRDQFTSGYTRMTADSGLQVFIPDKRDVPVKVETDNVQWFKDRNIPPPPQIVKSAGR